MRPLADVAVDCTGGGPGSTIAGTKPCEALHHRPGRAANDRHQVSGSEREMPHRRAVDLARAVDRTGGSAITIAGREPGQCSSSQPRPVRKRSPQVSSSKREMPYRRAVDETARGGCKVYRTILLSHRRSIDDAGQSQQPRTVRPEHCPYCCPQALSHSTPLNQRRQPSPDGEAAPDACGEFSQVEKLRSKLRHTRAQSYRRRWRTKAGSRARAV